MNKATEARSGKKKDKKWYTSFNQFEYYAL